MYSLKKGIILNTTGDLSAERNGNGIIPSLNDLFPTVDVYKWMNVWLKVNIQLDKRD